jgi:hypothetical protein
VPGARRKAEEDRLVNVRRSIAAAAVVLAVPVLSSCGINFNAQTEQVYNPTAGVEDRSGEVDVLNALIVSGTDGSGTVIATLVNNDQVNEDTLKSVSGAGKDTNISVKMGGATTIPAGGFLNLATDGDITATGSEIVPGKFVDITFSFDRAQAVTLEVPVMSHDNPDYAEVKVP